MSFYYTREPGPDGQIATAEGEAAGTDLATLLVDGALPVRAAVELVSYVADILTIAAEDDAVHGDIRAEFVRVDAAGAVSLVGYGDAARVGLAPEGVSELAADTYGLGLLLIAALGGQPLGALSAEPSEHDRAALSALKRVSWQELTERPWVKDVVHFMATVLAFHPEERPEALDVANVLAHVGEQSDGGDLVEWAAEHIHARPLAASGSAPPAAAPIEDLGEPTAMSQPLSQTAAFRVRKAGSARGQETSAWTREKIAAMLDEESDFSFTPVDAVGGESEPMTAEHASPAPEPTAPPPPVVPKGAGVIPPTEPLKAGDRGPATSAEIEPVSRPIAVVGMSSVPAEPSTPPAPKRGRGRLVVSAAFVVLAVVGCGGTALLAGVAYWYRASLTTDAAWDVTATEDPGDPGGEGLDAAQDTAPRDPEPPDDGDEPDPADGGTAVDSDAEADSPDSPDSLDSPDEQEAEATPAPETTPAPSPALTPAPAPVPRPSTPEPKPSAPTTAPSKPKPEPPSPSPKPPAVPAPSESPSGGPHSLTLSFPGTEATVSCDDGQTRTFTEQASMNFRQDTSCKIAVADASGSFDVKQSGSLFCRSGFGRVACQ